MQLVLISTVLAAFATATPVDSCCNPDIPYYRQQARGSQDTNYFNDAYTPPSKEPSKQKRETTETTTGTTTGTATGTARKKGETETTTPGKKLIDTVKPTLTPNELKGENLTTIDLNFYWPFACQKKQVISLQIEANATKAGAVLSANANTGYEITSGTSKLTGEKNEATVKEAKLNNITYTGSTGTKEGATKLSFLFYGQKLDPSTTYDTYIELELACGKNKLRFTKKDANAPFLKVSAASSPSFLFTLALVPLLITL